MAKKYKSADYVDSSDEEAEEYSFEPPKKYQKVSFEKKFGQVKSKDKEIWIIKAPKGFDFSKVKQLPINFHINERTKLENGGRTYEVQEDNFEVEDDATKNKYRILEPMGRDTLRVSDVAVKRFYSIYENVSVPEIDHEKVFEPREDVVKKTGLSMRHFATGYKEDDFSELQRDYDELLDGKSAESQAGVGSSKNSSKKESKAIDKGKTEEAKKDKKEKKEKKDKADKKEKKEKKDKKHKKEKKSSK